MKNSLILNLQLIKFDVHSQYKTNKSMDNNNNLGIFYLLCIKYFWAINHHELSNNKSSRWPCFRMGIPLQCIWNTFLTIMFCDKY
jgi:hypothetical protein